MYIKLLPFIIFVVSIQIQGTLSNFKNHILPSKSVFYCSIHAKRLLPTRPLGEHNVIRVLVRITFDELNTCEIFPMPHGLFEQCFMRTAEAAVDLVRYYPEIPYPFFSCRGRSPSPCQDYVPEIEQIS